METKAAKPVAWDDYFPVLNKVILVLLLVGGMLIATGVDVVQLGGRLLGRSGDAEAAVSSSSGDLVVESKPTSASRAGGYWKTIILAVAGMLGVVILVFYVLSVGGRDAERTQEQSIAKKKESQPIKSGESEEQKLTPEEAECNLASYKLFQPAPDAAALPVEQAST